MNPWKCEKYKEFYTPGMQRRTGLRLHFYRSINGNIDCNARLFLLNFAKWLRRNYEFPIRVNVYIKNSEFIRSLDGELVSATFFAPFDRTLEPYAKISAGDYTALVKKYGTFSALCSTAASLAHELTHYFQWINGFDLSEKQAERQAKYYSEKIVYMFLDEGGEEFLERLGIIAEDN
ncbi:MAG: hypothetical protein K2N72_10405 [Oscillospiraceae bacterium]|nr:hypothetical protein [Oscillospiraceae bacterium]